MFGHHYAHLQENKTVYYHIVCSALYVVIHSLVLLKMDIMMPKYVETDN